MKGRACFPLFMIFFNQINLTLCYSVETYCNSLLLGSFPTDIGYYSLCCMKQERERQGKSWGRQSGTRWSSLQVKLEKRWNTEGRMKVVLKKCLNSNGKTQWEDQAACSALSPPICHFQGKNLPLLGRCGGTCSPSGSKSTSWWFEGERWHPSGSSALSDRLFPPVL